jgi:hypothetical protein
MNLFNRTVDIICDEFGFYYAGVFLLDETGQYAVLKAGRGEAGRAMINEGHPSRHRRQLDDWRFHCK